MTSKTRQPQPWQTNPDNITATRLQYWHSGTMLTTGMSKERARTLVAEGKAFIINDQAIGAMVSGQMSS